MNGSGLIYAAIVGAWAAYLVPMWLRRQDELNEARPADRFTTAIRILSRRGAFERRSARALAEEGTGGEAGTAERAAPADPLRARQRPAKPTESAPPAGPSAPTAKAKPVSPPAAKRPAPPVRRDEGRAALLTRRRRVVASLFAGFTAAAVPAGLVGVTWLWVLPAIPCLLLSAYIVHLRGQERRRYEAGLRRLGRPASRPAPPADAVAADPRVRGKARPGGPPEPRPPADPATPQARQARAPRPPVQGGAAPRRREREPEEPALAEWIAELATAEPAHDRDAWDPIPVPLPTYVTAPVVPRGEVEPEPEHPRIHAVPDPTPSTGTGTPPTPLFDQYAEDTRAAYGSSVDALPLYEHEWRRAAND